MTIRKRLLALPAAVLAVGMLLVPGANAAAVQTPSVSASASSDPSATIRLIVRTGGDVTAVQAALAAGGGRVVAHQDALGMLVAEGPARLVTALERIPGVLVSPDRDLQVTALGFDPSAHNGSMTKVTQITGATGLWKSGFTGKGVDVALIDTGVAPVPGLTNSARVVVGPDLSFESQSTDTRYLDSYGHGSHMAGIIAGRGVVANTGTAYAADTENFYGMAPDSRLVSIKVADRNGVVDVSQVIAAVNWVAQFGKTNGLNVRVLNLSLGLDSPQNAERDPLSWAAEMAWRKGIVVVASVGNNGDSYPGLNSPAYNPRLLAVGAADTKGTTSLSDDTVPSFSASQGGNFNTRGPDLIAPGVGIVSMRVPGSTIADKYASARVATDYIRGSGTSQAAAVVSGAVALLLQQRPTLTPDQVKGLLMNTATPLAGISTGAQGRGELNLAKAVATTAPAVTALPPVPAGTGEGSIESARGGKYVSMDGKNLVGELTAFGGQFSGQLTAAKMAANTMWSADGTTWNGSAITGAGFTSDTTTWAGRTWAGRTWAGRTWAGNAWTGRTWAGVTWTGRTWAGGAWTGGTWSSLVSDGGWASGAWATGNWQ